MKLTNFRKPRAAAKMNEWNDFFLTYKSLRTCKCNVCIINGAPWMGDGGVLQQQVKKTGLALRGVDELEGL